MRHLAIACLIAFTTVSAACEPRPAPTSDAPGSGSSAVGEVAPAQGSSDPPSEPGETDVHGDDGAANGSPSEPTTDGDTTVTVGNASPNDVAAPLLLGVETQDPELVEEALRTLSRNLAVWRRRPAPVLVESVRAFAASSSAPVWAQIDARFVPPAIELLLEIRDMAAVARLTTAFAESAAEPMLRGPRALVARDTTPRARIDAEPGCALHVDGAAADGSAEVLVGSHQVGCSNSDRRLVVLFANEHVAIGADAVRVVEGESDGE